MANLAAQSVEDGVFNNLLVQGKVTFNGNSAVDSEDTPRLSIENGTINNCQEGGVLLKVYACTPDSSGTNIKPPSVSDVIARYITCGRNILTTVARGIAYNRISWRINGEELTTGVAATFTGYIQPLFAESALIYLTVSGTAQLWVGGKEITSMNNYGTRQTVTTEHTFSTTNYVPFVLHYASTAPHADSALILEWSFPSAPARTIVLSKNFAYTGSDTGSVLLGPISAHGNSQFHGDVDFQGSTRTQGNLNVDGDVTCNTIGSSDGTVSLDMGNDKRYLQLTGEGLHLQGTDSSAIGTSAPDPLLRISASDGTVGLFGMLRDDNMESTFGDLEKHVTLSTAIETGTSNVAGVPPPLTFIVGDVAVSTLRDSKMTVSVPLVANSGMIVSNGDLHVGGDIFTTGVIHQSGNVIFGNAQSTAAYGDKFALVGDNGSALTGPHFATYTSLDMEPLFQISSFSHNNISLNFDASYDGTQLVTHPSSYGAQFSKSARQLAINYGKGHIWATAWSVDLTDGSSLFSGKGSVFSHDDGSGIGSLRLAPIAPRGDTSIAFYNSVNMRAELASDFFRLGYVNGVFSLTDGGKTPLFSVSTEGDSSFLGRFSVTGAASFLGDISVAGSLAADGACLVNSLTIRSEGSNALSVGGSTSIAGNMTVGGRVLAGAISISSNVPRLTFNAPSAGPRIVFAKSHVSTQSDIAMGTGPGGSLWVSIAEPTVSCAYEWLAGDQIVMALSGAGDLTLNSQGGSVAYRDVDAVTINANSPNAALTLGENWEFRATSSSFVLNEVGSRKSDHDTGLELPVIHADRDALTGAINVSLPVAETLQLTQGTLLAYKGEFTDKVTAAHLLLEGDSSGRSHIKFLDHLQIVSTPTSSKIHSQSSLELNCGSDAGQTVIHRGNTSPLLLYRGDETVFVVDNSGCTLSSKLNIQDGDVIVESGFLTVKGQGISSFDGLLKAKAGVSLFTDHGLVFSEQTLNDDEGSPCASLNYNSSSRALVLQSVEGDAIIRSRTGIKLDPGKGDVRATGTIRVKNAALTDKGVLLTSTANTSVSLSSLLERDQWYYLGRVNTTPNGTGPDEAGCLNLELSDCALTTVVTVTIAQGVPSISMHKTAVTTLVPVEKEASRVVIWTCNGNFHAFVKVSVNASSGAYLAIKTSTLSRQGTSNRRTNSNTICVPEGSNKRPNGDESNFSDDSFVCIFDSDENASESSSVCFSHGTFTDALNSSGVLTVTDKSQLYGGVQTGCLSALSNESPLLRIASQGKTYMTIGEGKVLFSTSLFPDPAGHVIDLGSDENPFHNAIFSGNVSVATHIEAGDLLVNDDAVIKGSLALETNFSVLGGLSTFLDIEIVGAGKISGPLAANSITSTNLSCSYLNATGQVSVAGSILLRNGDDDSMPSIKVQDGGTQTLTVQATDIFLAESLAPAGGGIRIAADGTIRSLRDFAISCGSGNTISLGDTATACVRIPAKHCLVEGEFTNQGEASFEDKVSVSGDVRVFGNLLLGDQLVFGSPVGEISVMIPPLSSPSHLIEWSAGDRVSLCVPDIDTSDASLTLMSRGDVVIGGNGGLVCSKGTGTFANIVAAALQCGDVRVKNRVSVGEDSSLAELAVSSNGLFSIAVGQQHAFEIASDATAAKFYGDLATGGKHTALSLQVGEHFRVHNDGSVTFTDVNDTTAGRVEIVPPTGVQACALLFSNPSGDLRFQAAKDRGFSVAAVSGNATFQGQLVIESGLDVDTSMSSDVPSAALQVHGGIMVKRSVLIEGSLHLASDDNVRFSIAAPRSVGDSAETGYTLRLPSSLPTEAGQCLVSNTLGQLSWKTLAPSRDPALLSLANPTTPPHRYSFTAANDITDDIVDNFFVTGHSFHVNDFTVTVLCNTSRQVASFEMRGVRRAGGWQTIVNKTVGDDLGITLKFLSNGQLSYSSAPLTAWKSTTFTWTALVNNNSGTAERKLLGSDRVIGKPNESYGSFLAVLPSTCTRSSEAETATFWAGTHFGKTQLEDELPGKEVARDTFAATVHIADSPDWNVSDGKKYALVVSAGESNFRGPISVQNTLSSESLKVSGPVSISGALKVGSGSELTNIQKGILHVGPSSAKCATFDIIFSQPMMDVAYTMLGNAVSADPESPDAFTCTFKNLTRAGCRVTVCNILNDSWTDVTLRVHWFAVL